MKYFLKTRKFDNILIQLYSAVCNQKRIEKWTKSSILFSKKGGLRIAKNYRGIFHTAKVYYAMLLICIQAEIEKILRKNQRNWSPASQIQTIHWIIKGVHRENLELTILFIDFFKAFDSCTQGKDETNTTVTVVMMLSKTWKQWFTHPKLIPTSSTLLLESCKEIH